MSPLEKALEAFATQATTPHGFLQLAVIAAGLGFGWLAARVMRRRVTQAALWKFGTGGFVGAADAPPQVDLPGGVDRPLVVVFLAVIALDLVGQKAMTAQIGNRFTDRAKIVQAHL